MANERNVQTQPAQSSVTAADNLRDPFTAAESCDDAADLLDAIDALHTQTRLEWVAFPLCQECDQKWPCTTARLLHPEEARRG